MSPTTLYIVTAVWMLHFGDVGAAITALSLGAVNSLWRLGQSEERAKRGRP